MKQNKMTVHPVVDTAIDAEIASENRGGWSLVSASYTLGLTPNGAPGTYRLWWERDVPQEVAEASFATTIG